ncbi:Ger(x)C family spore germination protein [Ornithinibacillus scapharcae]|uniref:Ger(x)C family spore germination protein n=1 Tax=Ornithinibacillus scapharcae TaxID=1147159 RepID=UPI000225BD05|nr:Ger(x)C family spore germination protein [Ornithinibacillus scapharcae]
MKKSIIYVGLLVFISGCWDRYEIEERANILGIAIDIAEEEDMKDEPNVSHRQGEFPEGYEQNSVKITAQISLPGKIKLGPEGGGGEGSQKTSWTLETVGHTVKDAMANLQQQLAEKLYLGHVQIIVISEEIAKRGVEEINDYFRRSPEVRRTAWMIVNGGDAKKVLEAAPPVENVSSLYLSNTLDNAVRFGKLPREYLGKYWINLSSEGIDPVLPAVQVINNDRLLIEGVAYFKEDKMIGKISPIESGVFMGMRGKTPGGYSIPMTLPNENGVFMVKATTQKPKINLRMENGKPDAEIKVTVDATVEEEVDSNQLKAPMIEKLEKETMKKANQIASELIEKLQSDGSDIFGIGARIRAKYASYWDREVKSDERWAEIYKEMDIRVDYDINITDTGMEWK